ncbi:MAG TPA: 1-(5-phosphoribosyl)-5-[(5-phosphoribosylamino)methylideneamino] imidazole-4-carboxamide isomerase [Candidatus Limnocylindrales bacterium]
MTNASTFEILPAIDLLGGRVVRLRQGDFDRETAYSTDPAAVARSFAEAGATWIHVVDLDGARSGRPVQADVIRTLIREVGGRVRVEVAGGLRTIETATEVLRSGASRVVLGTAALADPKLVGALVATDGADRVAVAIDVRDGRAIGHGWTSGTVEVAATEAIAALADSGVTTFEVTAIDRDGQLGGPDLHLYERLVRLGRGRIIASGGIAALDDLRDVRALGCSGAILGRALYEGRLDLAAAISVAAGGTAS